MTRGEIQKAAEEFKKLRRAGTVFSFEELCDFGELIARQSSGVPEAALDYLHTLKESVDALIVLVRGETKSKGKEENNFVVGREGSEMSRLFKTPDDR